MSKFKFRKLANMIRAKYPEALEQMGNNAVNHFKIDNFDSEGFVDETVEKWPAKKSQETGRRILVKTGKLRQSIRIISRSGNEIKIGTLVPYGKYHNFGTKRLPKRQFIGNSKKLERKNGKIIHQLIDKTIRSYR